MATTWRRVLALFLGILGAVVPVPPASGGERAAGDLRSRIEEISRSAQGRVGASVLVLETGESVSFHGDERFPMQSVYKLPIAMAVLQRVDRGTLKLAQRVKVEPDDFVSAGQHSPIRDRHPRGTELSLEELLRLNTSESDGTACDVLLDLVGGTAAVVEYLRGLGIAGIAVVDTEKEIGRDHSLQYRNWAAPDAAVALLKKLHEGAGLSAGSRALLLRMMIETPTGPRRLKGLLPAGAVVAHKTGSSGMQNGLAAATNDIGIVTLPDGRHLAIAVFVSDSKADEATREGVIAKIARAAWDVYGR